MKKERFKKRKEIHSHHLIRYLSHKGFAREKNMKKIVRVERGNRISGKEINTEYLSALFTNLKTLINTVQSGIFRASAKLQFI